VHAALLFRDSFDNLSFAGFKTAGNPAQILSTPVRAGTGAAWFYLNRDTSDSAIRTEIHIVDPKLVIGRTYWLGVSHFVPTSHTPDSTIDVFYNLHSRPDPGEDVDGAPFSLRTLRDTWDLVIRGDPNRTSPSATTLVRNFDMGPIQKGQYTDWVFRILLSYQANARLEAWKNGIKVLDYRGPNVYNDALGPFIKMGIYKPAWAQPTSSPITERTVFIDDVRVGDANATFAEVTPGSGTSPTPQPGSVQLASSSFRVNEAASTATITASRTGGSAGPVSVNYTTTAGGTATEGADYTFTSGTLTWADGDATPKAFSVPIINDTYIEGNESVGLALGNPAGGVTLGTPNTSALTIIDDDQAPPGTYTCGGQIATILGTAASETITGTAGADVIDGLGGNDLIGGLEGDDIICGEEGNDTLRSSFGNDQVFGENGDDIVRGGEGNDRVLGGPGTDQVYGDELNDALAGGMGTDRCDGGGGITVTVARLSWVIRPRSANQ
jgi:hypothetical protein